MSRTGTTQWKHVAAQVRADSREGNLPCALCRGAHGPIDYRPQAEADRDARDAGAWWLIGQPRPLAFACDHITPHAAGGTDTLDNAQPAHRACNEQAGAKRTPRRTRPRPAPGYWEPLNGNGPKLPGHGTPGQTTATHRFRTA